MTDSSSADVRELLSKLTDESLSPEEAEQLNRLLTLDPISQQEYLDHMLIHGLLQREFWQPVGSLQEGADVSGSTLVSSKGGDSLQASEQDGVTPHRPRFRPLSRPWMKFSLAATVLLAVGWLATLQKSDTSSRLSVRMTDPGFEQGLVSDLRIKPNTWYGDDVDIVRRYSDIVPMEGNQMLRFVKSTSAPERGCEIYQIIPLDTIDFKQEPLLIEASAFFNAADEEPDEGNFAFEIALFALAADPSIHPHTWPMQTGNALTFGGSQLPADTDSKSWQELKAQLSLPPGTRYLVVQLSVICTDSDAELDEFPGQFVDDVKVNLVSLR